MKRLEQLEEISNDIGCLINFAIQAGWSKIVKPDKIDDLEIVMSQELLKIRLKNMTYPGTIKVTVVEKTGNDVAK